MVGGRWVVENAAMWQRPAPTRIARQEAVAELAVANAKGTYLAAALEQAVGSFCIGLCRSPFHLHRYGGPLGL